MGVGEKIDRLESMFNEVAIGYDDGGCFWHFQYGPRGAGYMMSGIGERFSAIDSETLEDALDALFEHLSD